MILKASIVLGDPSVIAMLAVVVLSSYVQVLYVILVSQVEPNNSEEVVFK